MPLRRLLIDREVATAREVEEASARRLVYGGDLVTNLYEVAFPDELRLVAALAEATGLSAGPPGTLMPSDAAIAMLRAEEAALLGAIVMGQDNRGYWVVAVSEDLSADSKSTLEQRLNGPVALAVVPYIRLAEALSDLYGVMLPRRVARVLLRANGIPSGSPPSTPFADWVHARADDLADSPRVSSIPPAEQRALSAARTLPRGRKGRGPITLSFLRAELELARTREEVLDLFFEFAAPFFEFAALWLVSGELAEGYAARGVGPEADTLPAGALRVVGALRAARERRVSGVYTPDWLHADIELAHATGRRHDKGVMLVPIVVAGRTVALLYGDDAEFSPDLVYLADVAAAAPYASGALERLILSRRMSTPSPPWVSAKSPQRMPAAPARPAAVAMQAVAPPSVRQPPPPSLPRPPIPKPPAPVPPASVTAQVPQAASSAPDVFNEVWLPDNEYHRSLPVSRLSEQELPSIIVNVTEDHSHLVDDACRGDSNALRELARAGADALPALMAAFPGPCLDVRETDPLPAPREAGTIISLLLAIGDRIASSIAPYLDDADEHRRFWATMLFTDLLGDRALQALAVRATDSSGRIRRAGVAALKRAARDVPKAVVDTLARALTDASGREDARRALVFALGETGAALAVPPLVDALADPSDDVAETAHHALKFLTYQDFGRDARRWVSWARSSLGRHHVEWMMDGVLSESAEMRRRAVTEIFQATGLQVELPSDATREQIENLYDQLYQWWQSTGKSRFEGQSL